MRRVVFVVLSACVFVSLGFLASPAKAGEYYEGDGYYHRRHNDNVSYNSSCCYRKVVRHERSVRYVPADEDGYRGGYSDRPYRSSYHSDRPYHSSYYSDRPYRSSYYSDRPYRSSYYADRPYRSSTYYDRPYRSSYTYDHPYRTGYYGRYAGNGYAGYSTSIAASNYDGCYRKKFPVDDNRGGWVWGVKIRCD